MNNLNQLEKAILLGKKAINDYLGNVDETEFISDVQQIQSRPNGSGALTKLEMASLMIAQGMIHGAWSDGMGQQQLEYVTTTAVSVAKAVLEEVNK